MLAKLMEQQQVGQCGWNAVSKRVRVVDEVREEIASVREGLSDKVVFEQIFARKHSRQREQPVSTKALWWVHAWLV